MMLDFEGKPEFPFCRSKQQLGKVQKRAEREQTRFFFVTLALCVVLPVVGIDYTCHRGSPVLLLHEVYPSVLYTGAFTTFAPWWHVGKQCCYSREARRVWGP